MDIHIDEIHSSGIKVATVGLGDEQLDLMHDVDAPHGIHIWHVFQIVCWSTRCSEDVVIPEFPWCKCPQLCQVYSLQAKKILGSAQWHDTHANIRMPGDKTEQNYIFIINSEERVQQNQEKIEKMKTIDRKSSCRERVSLLV